MKLKEIIDFLDEKIPESLALPSDKVGFAGEYDLKSNINSIKIYMDLLPENDDEKDDCLIITHHPPLFEAKTPTYTIHSNWDIIDGGANDALAEKLKLDVECVFDKNTGIGRICITNQKFIELKKVILDNFPDARVVNEPESSTTINKIGIVSGFGLKNPDYIQLAKNENLDIFISGDLTQETAILAKKLNLTLIDLNHHDSEVPGLYALAEVIGELDLDIEVIDKKPIEKLTLQ